MTDHPETTAADFSAEAAQLEQIRLDCIPMRREPQPVECSICEWRGRRLVARFRPCPACGAKVDFR